jgi:hypothetical protein
MLFDVVSPRLSPWQTFKRRMFNIIKELPLIHCCYGDTITLVHRDEEIRTATREAMRERIGYSVGGSSIAACISAIKIDDGYDLCINEPWYMKPGVRMTEKKWDALLSGNCVPKPSPVCVVPKFVASVSLAIRAKIGTVSNTAANHLIVENTYIRLCREHNVRDVDIIAHKDFVLNCVFTERLFSEVSQSRRSLPQWLKLLLPQGAINENVVC